MGNTREPDALKRWRTTRRDHVLGNLQRNWRLFIFWLRWFRNFAIQLQLDLNRLISTVFERTTPLSQVNLLKKSTRLLPCSNNCTSDANNKVSKQVLTLTLPIKYAKKWDKAFNTLPLAKQLLSDLNWLHESIAFAFFCMSCFTRKSFFVSHLV